jgi:hypothetical protein
MAVTIDPRPTVFGDRMIITGSYEAGDNTIDLSSQFASIDAIILNASAPNYAATADSTVDPDNGVSFGAERLDGLDQGTFSGTTITIITPVKTQTTKAGTFLAIGRRS